MQVICLDARMFQHSGIGTYLNQLIPYLIEAPFRLVVLAAQGDEEALGRKGCTDLVSFTSPIYSVSEQIQFPIKIPRCDLFWSPHYNVPLLPIRAKKKMVTIHDVYHLAYYHTLSFMQKMYAKSVMCRAVRCSDGIITDSEFSRAELVKYTSIDSRKLTVIPLGIEQNPLLQNAQGQSELQKVPENFILAVGNVKPHKNISGLIHAFAQLVREGMSELELVIVGKKEGLRTAEDSSKLLQLYPGIAHRIHFLGAVSPSALIHLYRTAQVLVHPSFYEGFGFPPLEAMSVGCPVVVSDRASLPEVCGDAAVYMNPACTSDMAGAISRVLINLELQKELKQKGLEQSRKFLWKDCAEQHVNLIKTVLAI